MKKYYEILEVSERASKEVIERAYKVLVKKYHPDSYTGEKKIYAEQKMRDINEAYKILSDDFLREQYDLELQKQTQYDDIYQNNDNTRRNYKEKSKNINTNDYTRTTEVKGNNVGTYKGILDITKTVFKNRPKLKNIRELKKEDYIAVGLTAVIMIVLLVILWFIPITNGFIKNMVPFLK